MRMLKNSKTITIFIFTGLITIILFIIISSLSTNVTSYESFNDIEIEKIDIIEVVDSDSEVDSFIKEQINDKECDDIDVVCLQNITTENEVECCIISCTCVKAYETIANNSSKRGYLIRYLRFHDNNNRLIPLPFPYNDKYYGAGLDFFYRPLYLFDNETFHKGYDFYQAVPHLATSKYFSVEVIYNSNESYRNFYQVFNSLTIDLEQLQVVLLDDLVNTSDEFIILLKEGGIIQTDDSPEAAAEFNLIYTYFSDLSLEQIRKIIDWCSIPIDSNNVMTDRPNFFLTPGRIYFCMYDHLVSGNNYIFIDINDIESFLKVEKW
jgi:hypothetical protein